MVSTVPVSAPSASMPLTVTEAREPSALRRGVRDHRTGEDPDAQGGDLGGADRRFLAGVDDRGNGGAGGEQVLDQRVGGVVGGRHDDLAAHLDAVAVQVAAGRAGEHDARAVVVLEHEGAFVGAGGQDHLGRADVPDAFAGNPRAQLAGQVVGAALDGDEEVRVVAAEGGGAGQVGEFRRALEGLAGLGDPGGGGLAVDGLGGGGEQRSAGLRLFVDEDHAGAGLGGLAGRGQAGGAGADDEHVGVHVLAVVDGLVGARVKLAQARKQGHVHAVGQFHGGGREHRFVHVPGVAGADLDQRVGFLDAGGHDAARAVQVEGRAAGLDAGAQHGRGHGVAGEPGEGLAVDREVQRPVPVDAGGSRGLRAESVRRGGAHLVPPCAVLWLAAGALVVAMGCGSPGL